MRLPRPIIHYLFVRRVNLLTIGMAILLLGMVPLRASAATSQIACTPTKLQFGATIVGQTETLPVTMTNSGQTSATVSAITVDNSGFTTSSLSLPLVLLAGQSVDLNVSFTPTAMGWTGGNIKFFINSSNVPLRLQVVGTGRASEAVTASPSTVSFGQVAPGTRSTVPVVITNGRSWDVVLYALQTMGAGFSTGGATFPMRLGAGQSVTLNVTFAPQSAGTTRGSLFLAGAGLVIPLVGAGTATGQLIIGAAPMNFGNVPVGTTGTQPITLSAANASVTIFSAAISNSQFAVPGVSFPMTIGAGQGVSFNVTFRPQSSGAASGSLSFVSNAPPPGGNGPNSSVPLFGTGVTQGALGANPASLAFSSVQAGASKSLIQTLTNSGGSSLTISDATASGPGFSLSGLPLPLTLATGQSTSFTVVFSPSASGVANGNVNITSTASDSSLSIPLSGTGMTQGALAANPVTLAFSNVQVGNNASLPATLTNTGGTSLTISAATAGGPGFSLSGLPLPLTLNAGQSTSFTVLFSPSASGAANGNVNITSTGSDSSLSIPLSGTGAAPGALAANPTTLGFSSVQVGNSANLSITLTNTGGSTIALSQANLSPASFSISGLTLPLNLTANQSVTFTATYTPTGAGAAIGSLSVTSNASNSTLNIGMSGTGTTPGQLSLSTTSLGFGNVAVGSNSSLNGSLTASGASVTVTSASLSNSEFVLSGISLPATLAAGQSAPFTVTFTPQSSGATSGSLQFSSSASNSPAVESMIGTGTAATTAATQHAVDLTWAASANAVGYNIYRGTMSGGPYTMINTSLDGTTAYIDNTVVSGHTYYYVAAAVDGSSNESGYSNQTQAVIPNP